MYTIDLFANDIEISEAEKYIKQYFKNKLRYNGEVFIDELKTSIFIFYIVILKDDISRIIKDEGGSGVLRQKPCSIFIFSFVDKVKYVDLFGYNSNHRNIVSPFNQKDYSVFFLESENYKTNYRGRNKNNVYSSKEIVYLLQNYIFSILFNEHKAFFVNSYVYTIYTLYDKLEGVGDFKTFYFNTNYKFGPNPYSNIINQKEDINITTYSVKDIKNELKDIEQTYNELFQLVEAYKGNLALTSVTKENYLDIKQDIQDEMEFIVVEGMARTGKTVIAMRLLHDYPESNLLLMNYYFYQAIKRMFILCNVEFPNKRIFHHDLNKSEGSWEKGKKTNNQFLIVDEAQRLGYIPEKTYYGIKYAAFDEIENIINVDDHKHTIFLGDNHQRINKEYDQGLTSIIDRLRKYDKDYKHYYFDYSIGIPMNILNNIKYLLYPSYVIPKEPINNYSIIFTNSETEFINYYEKSSIHRKHLSTIYIEKWRFYSIGKYIKINPSRIKNFPYFLDETIKKNNILTPFELISRELDSIFIYIPSDVVIKDGELFYINENNTIFLLNQLYILFTRAKLEVYVYCENKEVANYFIEKQRIYEENIDKSPTINYLNDEEKELQEKTKYIIEDRGVTRLIHFTEKKNLDSILKNGILSVNRLKELGIIYDYNDEYRNDHELDAISLSVQNPNNHLLKSYKEKYPSKEYIALILSTDILTEIFNQSGTELAKRIYCNQNAAARIAEKSMCDINIMYSNEVEHFSFRNGTAWSENRRLKLKNQPTSNQAEILFFEDISPKFILDIKDI